MANEIGYYVNDMFYQYYGTLTGEEIGAAAIGQLDGEPGLYFDGALRFTNVPIPQGTSVNYALLRVYASEQGSSGSMKIKTYGIKETNTSAFTSNPFGRVRTTAVSTTTNSRPGLGGYINIDVTSQVTEIVGQGGWSSGNAMGFMMFDNGSDLNAYMADTDFNSNLIIRLSAEPNFFPTPGSISAPTFPAISSHGLKISKPGIDVKTATEDQLLLTTRKKELKIIKEGSTDCTFNVYKNVPHGMTYAPAHLAYVESGGYRFKLNRDLGNMTTDIISGGAQGYVSADPTNLKIIITASKNVYYYIFIDPLT